MVSTWQQPRGRAAIAALAIILSALAPALAVDAPAGAALGGGTNGPASGREWEMRLSWKLAAAEAQPGLPAPSLAPPMPVPPPEAAADAYLLQLSSVGPRLEADALTLDLLRAAQAAEAGPAAAVAATRPRAAQGGQGLHTSPAAAAAVEFYHDETTLGLITGRPAPAGAVARPPRWFLAATWARTSRVLVLPGNRTVLESSEVQLRLTVSGAALVCFAIAALCFALHRFLPSDDEDEAGCQEEGADADGSAAAEEGHGGKGAECPADAFITAAGYTKL